MQTNSRWPFYLHRIIYQLLNFSFRNCRTTWSRIKRERVSRIITPKSADRKLRMLSYHQFVTYRNNCRMCKAGVVNLMDFNDISLLLDRDTSSGLASGNLKSLIETGSMAKAESVTIWYSVKNSFKSSRRLYLMPSEKWKIPFAPHSMSRSNNFATSETPIRRKLIFCTLNFSCWTCFNLS